MRSTVCAIHRSVAVHDEPGVEVSLLVRSFQVFLQPIELLCNVRVVVELVEVVQLRVNRHEVDGADVE